MHLKADLVKVQKSHSVTCQNRTKGGRVREKKQLSLHHKNTNKKPKEFDRQTKDFDKTKEKPTKQNH